MPPNHATAPHDVEPHNQTTIVPDASQNTATGAHMIAESTSDALTRVPFQETSSIYAQNPYESERGIRWAAANAHGARIMREVRQATRRAQEEAESARQAAASASYAGVNS
jgi:hypothetical protein